MNVFVVLVFIVLGAWGVGEVVVGFLWIIMGLIELLRGDR